MQKTVGMLLQSSDWGDGLAQNYTKKPIKVEVKYVCTCAHKLEASHI